MTSISLNMSTFSSTFSRLSSFRSFFLNKTNRGAPFAHNTTIIARRFSFYCRNYSYSKCASYITSRRTPLLNKGDTKLPVQIRLSSEKLCLSCYNQQVNCFSDVNHNHTRSLSDLDTTSYLDCSDLDTERELKTPMMVYNDFLSITEEQQLLKEIEPYMKRLRYERDHWDNAIHDYRETERRTWSESNQAILDRVRKLAFPPEVSQLAYVHILDIRKEGYIKPHIDSVRFCGNTIAGLCLLSPCVMRLVHDKENHRMADVLLARRSLYIMRDAARYSYTHEVLPEENSKFRGAMISRDRRISVIMRNEPTADHVQPP